MNVFGWVAGLFSSRQRGLAIYKRGIARAQRRNHQGAIKDYTTAIGMPSSSAEFRAIVLYNRALVYVVSGEVERGIVDLEALLAIDEAAVNVKSMARQKLARIAARVENDKRSGWG